MTRVAVVTPRRLSRRRLFLAAAAAVVAACNGRAVRPDDALVALYAKPAADEWPDAFHQLKPEVQEAYRYAVGHRDVLQYIPCFCGCVNVGHTSNFDCYVREVYPDGRVRLDTMSFG